MPTIGEIFDKKRANSPAAKRRANLKAKREAAKPKYEAIKGFLPVLDPRAKKDRSLVVNKNFLSIYDYLDKDDNDAVVRAKLFGSKVGTGGARSKAERRAVGGDEDGASLKSDFNDTDTFDQVNPHRRVATPPIPSVLMSAEKSESEDFHSLSDQKKMGEMYYHQALTAEGAAEMTWEEKVSLAKEVYARQYEKIQSEDATNKSGISYIGRKLQKLFPSAKVETIDEEGMDHWSLTSNERLLRLNQRVQMDMAKVDNLDLQARFLNNSQWNVRDSLNVKSQEIFMDTAQSIIVREAAMVKMDELLQEVEKEYYEYALLKLQAQALDIPLNSEQIVAKKAKVLSQHQKLRVALAGYRTATLTIAENIKRMRSICRAEVSIRNVEVLITWYGVNYAKKMLTDTKFLWKYSVLRFWLPFEPNTFMIPPEQMPASPVIDGETVEGEPPIWVRDPSPAAFFDDKRTLYDRWYQKHKQYVRVVKRQWEEREREIARAREEEEREAELQRQIQEAEAEAAKPKSFYQKKLEARKKIEPAQHPAPAPAPAPARTEDAGDEEEREEEKSDDVDVAKRRVETSNGDGEAPITEKACNDVTSAFAADEESLTRAMGHEPDKVKVEDGGEGEDIGEKSHTVSAGNGDEDEVDAAQTRALDDGESIGEMSTSVLGQESAAELAALSEDFAAMSRDQLDADRPAGHSTSSQGGGERGSKEWEAIRDVCAAAWSFNEADGAWRQGPDVAPEFWKNYEYSPLLVETAVGLFELAPKAPLVPAIPFIGRVLKAKRFTEAESQLFMVVAEGHVYDEEGKETLTFGGKEDLGLSPVKGRSNGGPSASPGKYSTYSAFDNGLGTTLTYSSIAKSATMSELQHRQMNMCRDILEWTERDTELKRILIADLRAASGKSTSIPPAGGVSLEARSLAQASLSLDRSMLQSSSEVLIIDTEAGTEIKYEFGEIDAGMRVEVDEGGTFNTQQFGQSFAAEEEEGLGISRPSRAAPVQTHSHFYSPHGKEWRADAHSSLNKGDHHRMIRRDELGLAQLAEIRQPSVYNKDWWVVLLVTKLQTLIRRYQARRRVERVRLAVRQVKSCIKIQACIRRFLGLLVAAKRKVQFQKRMLALREELVFRHDCAIRITKFIRYCGNVNMGIKTTSSLLAYARAASKKIEREQRQSVYAQEGVSVKRPGSRQSKKGIPAVQESMVSGVEGIGELTQDMRHAVREIMKTDSRMECRLIPTQQDLIQQSLSISGTLDDLGDDSSETSEAGANTKRAGRKIPIQAKKRVFDVDAGLSSVRPVKAIYNPNAVYRTPAALMSAKERSDIIGDHVAKLRILEEARIEKHARLRKSISAVFAEQRQRDTGGLSAPESLEI